MVLVDRDPDRPVRFLAWRIRLFGAGAILALLGMYYQSTWLIWVAVAVLLVGFALRFVPEPEDDTEE